MRPPAPRQCRKTFSKHSMPTARQRSFFATLNSQNRFAILYRIQAVKRQETRARKIAQFVEMLSKGEKLHP